MKSLIVGFLLAVSINLLGLVIHPQPVAAQGDCSNPEDYDENHLVQRC